MSQCNREVAKTEQKLQSVESRFKERYQATSKGTDGRRSSIAKEHALRKKELATKQEAAARREAERLDMNLQKRLLDRYGYGRNCSPSAAVDSSDIELTPTRLAKEIEVVPKEGISGDPEASGVRAPVEYLESYASGDEGRDPSSRELSDAEDSKAKGKSVDKRGPSHRPI